MNKDTDSLVTLQDVWQILWQKKLLIMLVTFLVTMISLAYALLATEWYRAETLLAPAEQANSGGIAGRLGGLGGLVGLAGLDVGDNDSVEAIAIVQSRGFAQSFITDNELLTVLFEDQWEASENRWKADDLDEQPDVRDAVKYFLEEIQSIAEDSATGLVTVRIDWTDPVVAARWANQIVERLNEYMRQRAMTDANRNLQYLRSQLESNNVAVLTESIAGLMEAELQKLMLANGNEQYAFRILDPAQVPKERVWPKRLIILLLGFVGGFGCGIMAAFAAHSLALVRNRNSVVAV